MRNKLSLLALAGMFLGANVSAATNHQNKVMIGVGLGMQTVGQFDVNNQTENLEVLPTYLPSKANDKLSNTFAAFNNQFTPITAISNGSPNSAPQALVGWSTTTNTSFADSAFLPNLIGIGQAAANNTQPQLIAASNYKQISAFTPMLNYADLSSFSGSTGLTVSGQLGYKFYISGNVYVEPNVTFAYVNAKASADVSTVTTRADFYVDAINIPSGWTINNATTPTPNATTAYYIEPETQTNVLASGNIVDGANYAFQWNWSIGVNLGSQITDNCSVYVGLSYVQTRMKISLSSVSQQTNGLSSVYAPVGEKSTLDAASAITDQDVLSAPAYLGDGAETVSEAKMLSGIGIGVGFEYKITENMVIGFECKKVWNGQRTYEFEDLDISASGQKAAAQNTQANQQNNQQNNQQTTQQNNKGVTQASETDPMTQDVTIQAGPSYGLFGITLKMAIPTGAGSSC